MNDVLPITLPFLTPGKGTAALRADLLRQVGFLHRLPVDPHLW